MLVQPRILNENMTTSIRFCYKILKTFKIKRELFHSLFQNDFVSE